MWELAIFSYVESTCMNDHFTKSGDLGPFHSFNPATFYWSTCTKQGKWAVMYLCGRGIDFASFYDYDI